MAANPAVIFANDGLQPALRPEMAISRNFRLPVGKTFAAGTVLGLVSSATAVSAVKTIAISGAPAGGTFTIAFPLCVPVVLAYNAPLATVKTALETIFGTGNVVVTGTAGTSYVVTFQSNLANVRVENFTVSHAFTGGTSPAISSTNTTPGSSGAGQADAYASGNSDGTQVGKAILQHRVVPNAAGGETRFYPGSDAPKSFPAFVGGIFNVADLTGVDSNLLTLAGWRTVQGVLGSDGHLIALGL